MDMAPPIDPNAFATPFAAERASPRTNFFLMATIVIGVIIRPVRIRNLSLNGALIEMGGLPAAGTALTLRRGSLAVDAVLMWADEHRGGISFAAPIALDDWLPSGIRASRGQARVDRIVAKTRDSLAAQEIKSAECVGEWELRDHASKSLGEAAIVLEQLVTRLGDSSSEADRPVLDAATRTVRRIERLLRTESREEALQAIRLEDLQHRLERRRQD